MTDVAVTNETPTEQTTEDKLRQQLQTVNSLLAAIALNFGGRLRVKPSQLERVGGLDIKIDPYSGDIVVAGTNKNKRDYSKKGD